MVGRSIAARYPGAGLGGPWTVVGVMDTGNSSIDSEIFCDLNQLASDDNREDVLSSVLLRASDPVAKAALIRNLFAAMNTMYAAVVGGSIPSLATSSTFFTE